MGSQRSSGIVRRIPSRRARWSCAVVVLALFANSCDGAGGSGSGGGGDGPLTPGLELLAGDGFSLRYPADARLEFVDPTPPALEAVRVVGPAVAVRPVDGEWTRAGAAWVLDVVVWENPEALGLREWVEAYMIDREALSPPEVDLGTVAGEPAILVTTFGGDSWIRTWYLAKGRRVVELRYADVPRENDPIAPVARGVYALVLDTFRWADATR